MTEGASALVMIHALKDGRETKIRFASKTLATSPRFVTLNLGPVVTHVD